MKHYHNQNRGGGRGVYYRAEDVKIFTDRDPQSKSINTLLNSPKAYSRDHHHYQHHSGRQGSIQSTPSKPSSTAGSKQVPSKSPPSTTAPGPSGGVVIYYSPATAAVPAEPQVAKEKEIDVMPCPSSSDSDLKLEQTQGEAGEKGATFQSSITNKIVSSASCTTSPSPSSSSSASTVIHQPIICNQESKKMVVKSTPSMTTVTNQANESISVPPSSRTITGFKKYEISV